VSASRAFTFDDGRPLVINGRVVTEDEFERAERAFERVRQAAGPRHAERRRADLEQRLRSLEEGNRELERKLHEAKRRTFVDRAVWQRRITDEERAELERLYDADPEVARAFVADLERRESERTPTNASDDRAFEAYMLAGHGLTREELV
jgi:hypothetical protein